MVYLGDFYESSPGAVLTGADIYGHRLPNGNGNLKKFTGTRRTELNGTPSIV